MALEREKISLGSGVAVSRQLLECIDGAQVRHSGRTMTRDIADECGTQPRVVNLALIFLRAHPDVIKRSDISGSGGPGTESGL